MIVAVLLVAIVLVVCASGYVLRRSSAPPHAVYLDVHGAHADTIVGSLQAFGPQDGQRRGSRGFDMQHWTSVHWG